MSSLDLRSIAKALGGEVSGGQVLAPGPGHSPKDRSLSVKPDPNAPDGFTVHDFAGGDWKAGKDFVREKLGLGDFKPSGKGADKDKVVAKYNYVDELGEPVFRVLRWWPKSFSQQRYDGKGGWINGIKGVRRVPLSPARCSSLASRPDSRSNIAEGEKDCDALNRRRTPQHATMVEPTIGRKRTRNPFAAVTSSSSPTRTKPARST